MGTPVILSACRTAGGTFCGSLGGFTAHELGGFVIAEAVKRSGLRNENIREGVIGNVLQVDVGMNPARIAMINAGLPVDVPVFSVNQRYGTGFQTVMILARCIRLASVTAGVAGGMESASNVPSFLKGAHRVPDG
jgi:acetyl-CoA C-acetyltransferase